MIKRCLLFLTVVVIFYSYSTKDFNFLQTDYDVKRHIAEISWFNKSCAKSAKASYVLYNRTQRVLNTIFETLIEFGSDMIVDVQLYKFISNEYRFFPVSLQLNVCAEYMRNSFGLKDVFLKTSNIRACNMKKGTYYAHNALLDVRKLPPNMPFGSYKSVNRVSFHSTACAQLELYLHFVEKPLDWKNFPSFTEHPKH